MNKPNYIFLYKNDSAVDNLMRHFPFEYVDPIKIERRCDGVYIEYEHIIIRCNKVNSINQNLRGYKTWQVLVEDCLYEKITQEQMNCILIPIMAPHSILGGRVVSVSNC